MTLAEVARAALFGTVIGMVSMATVSLYLHRGLTHAGLEFTRLGRGVFRTTTWLLIGTTPRKWIAVHRKHHRFADTGEDPHSPHNFERFGVARIFFGMALEYNRSVRTPDEVQRYAPDYEPDGFDRLVFSHGPIGLALFYALVTVAFGPLGALVVLGFHFVTFYASQGAVNSLGHWPADQDESDKSTNHRVLVWVTMGESLHRNHHAHPRSPSLEFAGKQVDPGWRLARILMKLRLLHVSRGGLKAMRRAKEAPAPTQERQLVPGMGTA